MRALIVVAPVALVASVALAACGTATIKTDGAEKSVTDVVARQTGFHPKDVKCPSGVEAKAGKTFDCHFTGPEPKPYVAHMRVTAVNGEKVTFFVSTAPAG